MAAEPIEPFVFLSLAQSQHASSLLIQFDGSARQSSKIGGAGIVVLAVTPEAISVVSWHAFALHKCKDSIYAEAFGCLEALRTAHSHVQSAFASRLTQSRSHRTGGYLAYCYFLTFKDRFQPARCPSPVRKINMEYKPRECNQFADYCAGLGTIAANPDRDSEADVVFVDLPYELCSTLGFAIRDAFPCSPFDRVFTERPHFSALNLKVLHQHHTFMKSFARYKRHFGQNGSSSLVQYRPTAFDLGGRLYAQTPSAQLFPKPLRISLFGHSHSDVDMIQAHYELVRRLSQSQHLLPAWKMRQWLKDMWARFNIPEFPNFEKLWPTHILNMASVAEMRNSLLKRGCGCTPQALEEFIHHLYEAKVSVPDHPPAWCPPRQLDPGRGCAYRILENIERTVLLKLLDVLKSLMMIESIG